MLCSIIWISKLYKILAKIKFISAIARLHHVTGLISIFARIQKKKGGEGNIQYALFADTVPGTVREGLHDVTVVVDEFFRVEPAFWNEAFCMLEVCFGSRCCPVDDADSCLDTQVSVMSCIMEWRDFLFFQKKKKIHTPPGTHVPHILSPPSGTTLGKPPGTGG